MHLMVLSGATCTYQGYCATNTSGPSGAYQGCYADKSTKRILGTMTSGVDYIKADVSPCPVNIVLY